MGKRLIQQARGHGSFSYRVRRRAFNVLPKYILEMQKGDEFEVVKLISSGGHSAPVAKLRNHKTGKIYFNLAANGLYEGLKTTIGGMTSGDVSMVGDLENGTKIFNLENNPNDGGKLVRSGGNCAIVIGRRETKVIIRLPSKKEKLFNAKCRATVGETAGQGRLDKPILKAGKKHHIMKTKSKLWPRTSAIKMNAVDHPFGSGRGKRIKSKIAQRNSPPGQKVGLIRPRRTGRTKK
ncbi:MAG: 50S ribosomal protein L2 [archaeon]